MGSGIAGKRKKPGPLASQGVADLHCTAPSAHRELVARSFRGFVRFYRELALSPLVFVSAKPIHFPPDTRRNQVVLVYDRPLGKDSLPAAWFTYWQARAEAEAGLQHAEVLQALRAFADAVDEAFPMDYHELVNTFGLAQAAHAMGATVQQAREVFDGTRPLTTDDLFGLAKTFPDFDIAATVFRLSYLRQALDGSAKGL